MLIIMEPLNTQLERDKDQEWNVCMFFDWRWLEVGYQWDICRVSSETFTWHCIDWEAREASRKFVSHGYLRYIWGSEE